jgi:hypothetical protein
MKKTIGIFVIQVLISVCIVHSSFADPVVRTIKASGGDYATFTDAITALNSGTFSATGVTFNVDAGFTETFASPTAGNITATGTVSTPIVFQKSGSGSNPLITAGVGVLTTTDYIIKIFGGDYITFDGIDVQENPLNTTATTQMEYGYYIVSASGTDGAQYDTIRNAMITLRRTNTKTIGLYQVYSTAPTDLLSGCNNYNKYYNITVENSYVGISLNGYSSLYYDTGCEIGTINGGTTTIGASTANDIGGGTTSVYGIKTANQAELKVFNTTVRNVNSALAATSTYKCAGIFIESSVGRASIFNNKIGPVTNSSTYTINKNYVVSGIILTASYPTDTMNAYNNFIFGINGSQTTATTSQPYTYTHVAGIVTGPYAGVFNLYFNSIRIEANVKINSACVLNAGTDPNTVTLKNNIFSNFTATQSGTPKHYGIMRQATNVTFAELDNNDYYIANSGNGFVGYYAADKAAITDWRTVVTPNIDVCSFSANPTFVSTTDLHITTGTNTLLKSGGTPISGITTDIDGATRNSTNPDVGADEGSFNALAKSLNWLTVNQASTASTYANNTNQEIIRIDISLIGSTGTFPLNSVNVASKNVRDADVSNVRLFRTTTPTFSTTNQIGSTTNFSGGTAAFGSLNYNLPGASTTYLWVAYDIASDAVAGNTVGAKILANQININGSTYPSSEADPGGSRRIAVIMSGTYTIDASGSGDRNYTTFTAAITDLNYRGFTSSLIFNVAAGFTESTTAPLTVTTTGTSSKTITFQKSGSGANPLITRTDAGSKTTTALAADGDAIIQINGTDYITFDGIDVQASQSTIEYGYFTYKPSGTDGCQNDTIRNCNITMVKSTANCVNTGICISNGPTSVSASTGVSVTANSGRNENIVVSGNTIQNVNAGIYALGYSDALSPYVYYDQNIKIGTEGAGNTIRDFGWTTNNGGSVYGIYSAYSNNFNASYNNLNNTAGGGAASINFFYPIYSSYTKATNITYSYNTLSLTTTGARYAYAFGNNAGDANSTINIHHNIIEDCVLGSSGGFCVVNNGVSSVTYNIYSNIIRDNTISTSSATMFVPGSSSIANIYDNAITNNTVTGGTSTNTAISISSGVSNVYNNSISGYSATSAALIYAINITGGTDVNVYNNLISDLNSVYTSATVDAIRGISITSTTASSTIELYNNTIYLNTTTGGADFWTSCVYHTYNATATTAALDMRNNILVNTSTPSGAGKTVAFRRSAATDLSNYSTSSNNNLFYAGTPGVNNVIFNDGSNSLDNIADYKTLVTPRDANSVSGDPGLTSATNMQPDVTNSNCWNIKGKGDPTVNIATDYAGNARSTTIAGGPTCLGAYEFTPSVAPPAATETGTPGPGSTTTYTQSGRPLMNIVWGATDNVNQIKKQVEKTSNTQKVNTQKINTPKVNTTKDNIKKDNTPKDNIKKDNTPKDNIKKDNTPKDNGKKSQLKSGGERETRLMSFPTSVTIQKYSGSSVPDTASVVSVDGVLMRAPMPLAKTGTGYAKVTTVGGDPSSAVSYTYYYGSEELGNVTAESDLILAMYDINNQVWVSFPQGTGTAQSNLNTTAKTITVSGLTRVDNVIFMLCDKNYPLKRLGLDLTVLIQGLYNDYVVIPDPPTYAMVQDTAWAVIYREETSPTPWTRMDSIKVVIGNDGTCFGLSGKWNNTDPLPSTASNYWLVIRHRNALETWSSLGANQFSDITGVMAYNFTTSAGTAFGDNLVLVNGKYCIYSGDCASMDGYGIQDGFIEVSDVDAMFFDNSIFTEGWVPTDLNGDTFVEVLDFDIFYPNNASFIEKQVPPNFIQAKKLHDGKKEIILKTLNDRKSKLEQKRLEMIKDIKVQNKQNKVK